MERKMEKNKELMERKMDENKEEMKRDMEQMIMEALNGRPPKIDKVSERTRENNGSVWVEQLSNNKNFLGGYNFNNGVTYGWSPKGVNLPKVELMKFDGT
jgi:hypothetical protein